MEILNNISPIPFYSSLGQQQHRLDYAFGQIYPLIVPFKFLLPFQFIIDCSAEAAETSFFNNDFNNDYYKGENPLSVELQKIELYSLNSEGPYDITSLVEIKSEIIDTNLILIKHAGSNIQFNPKIEGPYYLKITFSGLPYIYSDVFNITKDLSNYIKLEYSNSYGLNMAKGYIDFSDNFRFICYINALIGKPEYVFEEEATSRGGYTFIESQVSKKTYKFTCIAPEYLCDALRIVRLCDFKRISTKYKSYRVTSFSMAPEWEEQGDLAAVNCEFEVDNVIQNIGNL